MKRESQIAALGCVVCRLYLNVFSPASIHHVRKLATSKKRKKAPMIGLCPLHHQNGGYGVALHAGEKEFEKNFKPVLDLLEDTERMLSLGNKL